jgi:ABC-type antimicrobial peptide transport system permease subunit
VNLKPEDVDAILRDAPSVKAAAPIVRGRAQLLFQGRNYFAQSLQGSSPAFLDVRDWLPMAEGAPFTDGDVRSANAVCLVGATVVRELFEGESPVGKDMRIGNVTFKVLGVLSKKGANMMGQDQDDTVVAPWTTVKYRVAGGQSGGGGGGGGSSSGSSSSGGSSGSSGSTNSLNNLYPSTVTKLYPDRVNTSPVDGVRFTNIDQIIASAHTPDQVDAAVREVTQILRQRHRLQDDQVDDFTLRNMTEVANTLSETRERMTNLLLTVALISLIVGGVGIMNIMLVSVTERTREIGLRMAVGARARDILTQFLTESIVLCLAGGVLGIALGMGSSWLVTQLLQWPTESSPAAVVAAVVVSATVGIVFGYYPAWKASRLDPIDALRYE